MTDKNMPERELDSIMILTQRMRELEAADIYGIWDWDSDNFKPKLTLLEHEVDSMARVRELTLCSQQTPPTPPYLTPRPSAYDIPPADSIYAAKVSDLVQSEQSDCELDIANVLAHEFTLLRQAIDSLPRLIAEQLKQPTVKKESEKEKKYRAARQFAESNTTPIPQRSEKNKAKEELLELLRLVDPATAVYHDILLALEKMTSSSTR